MWICTAWPTIGSVPQLERIDTESLLLFNTMTGPEMWEAGAEEIDMKEDEEVGMGEREVDIVTCSVPPTASKYSLRYKRNVASV